MTKVHNHTKGWTKVGRTPVQKLETLTQRVQKALKEEVGQNLQWKTPPQVQPKSEKSKALRNQVNHIRKLQGEKTEEGRRQWYQEERKRCQQKQEQGSTLIESEKKTLTLPTNPTKSEIQWVLRKRSEALKVEAVKEEERLLIQKWKERAEVKRSGAEYTPWATHPNYRMYGTLAPSRVASVPGVR